MPPCASPRVTVTMDCLHTGEGSQTKSSVSSSPDVKASRKTSSTSSSKHKDKKNVTKRFSFTTNKLQSKSSGGAEVTEVVMEEEEEDDEREEEFVEEETVIGPVEQEARLPKSLQQCSKLDFKTSALTWYTHKCLPLPLHGSTLQLHPLGDRVYLCGGVTESSGPNSSLLYCSIRNLGKWTKAASGVPHFYCPSVMLEEELVLVSGISAGSKKLTPALSSYNLSSQLWVQRHAPLPTARSSTCAFVFREYMIVMGGQNEKGEIVGTVDVLHLPSQQWHGSAPLPVPTAGASMVICENVVYLVGGVGRLTWIQTVQCAKIKKIISSSQHFTSDLRSSSSLTSSRRSSGVWRCLHDCPFTKMTALCSGNQLLTLGGEQLTRNASAEPSEWIWIYDKDQDTWSPVQGMPSPRKLCAVTMLPDNMLIVGGEPHFTNIDIAEIV